MSVYGQILYDKHPMLVFLQEMRESGVHGDPSAWPLGTFITSLQRACLQVRRERSGAGRVLQGALPKAAFVSLEDILVPDALCEEMLPQLAQSSDYDVSYDEVMQESSGGEGKNSDMNKAAIARSIMLGASRATLGSMLM